MSYITNAFDLEKKAMNYKAVLKEVHKILKPRNYVEIGVCRGRTLAFSEALSIGIDPKFKIDCDLYSNKKALKLFQMTSDDFFKDYSLYEELNRNYVHLSFIDGLHLFEQVLKDFINLEKYAAPDSLIFFHDVVPPTVASAAREQPPGAWVGDVWKIVPCLRKYREDLNIEIINAPPSGLLVVRNLDPNSKVLQSSYDAICDYYLNELPNDSASIESYRNNLILLSPDEFLNSEYFLAA